MKFLFDPIKVGTYECNWWLAHHEKDQEEMVKNLLLEHLELYQFSQSEAEQAISFLATAAKYHDLRHWDQAIQAVTFYYQEIKNKTQLDFNPQALAKLEIAWWQIHDELEFNPDKTKLAEAFACLYATQFSLTLEAMRKVGQLKAQATSEHDQAEDLKTDPDQINKHWENTRKLLIQSYEELLKVIA